MNGITLSRKKFGVWLLFYLAFVVYGSLIPFEYRPHGFHEALEIFARIPYLQLGMASRADWVANILLYIPLGFLAAGWLQGYGGHRGRATFLRLVAAFLLCSLVAVCVEFTQIFFAPRTVSLNDLIAEHLGSLGGIALWVWARRRLPGMVSAVFSGGWSTLRALLVSYLVLYLVMNLFPFDFLVSLAELREKLAAGMAGWLVAPAACDGAALCLLKFGAEMVAAVPVGLLLHLSGRTQPGRQMLRAVVIGAILGMGLELVQFFLASGISQGLSVISRTLGVTLGAGIGLFAGAGKGWLRPRRVRWLLAAAAPLYLLLLLYASGWLGHPWYFAPARLEALEGRMFLPFYYHYFTTETQAMMSLLANVALYLPVGVAYWVMIWSRGWGRPRAWRAFSMAALVAAVMEAGKLFVAGKHPDPTNVLIAGVSAGAIVGLLEWVRVQWASEGAVRPVVETPTVASRQGRENLLARLGALLALSTLVAWLYFYPGPRWILATGLLGYMALLRRWPNLWLLALPALLPVLDFAPWTGWSLVDEFDALVLATLAAGLWRLPPGRAVRVENASKAQRFLDVVPRALWWLFLLLLAIGALEVVRGLWPLAWPEANDWASYLSRYHAWRVGRGVVWMILLLPLLRHALQDSRRIERLFVPGMLLGLLLASLATLWERWLFPGLFNFSTDFRSAGLFAEMNTGGAYIDGYLAAALPLVAACFLLRRGVRCYLAGLTLYLLGLYAFLVTFTRIDYLALVVSALVIVVGMLRARVSERRFYLTAIPLIVLGVLVMMPVLMSPYTQSRFATLERDFHQRLAHYQDSMRMVTGGIDEHLLGMGMGSYPRINYLFRMERNQAPAAAFRLMAGAEGDVFVRLWGGPIYLLQDMGWPSRQIYRLTLKARSEAPGGELVAMLCEKTLLYTLRCVSGRARVTATQGQWKKYHLVLDASRLTPLPGRPVRPLIFSLYNAAAGSIIDVDDLVLANPQGENILQNGDFSGGARYWFFTVDDILHWHLTNMWLHLLFEQGWLGMVVAGWLVLAVGVLLARKMWHGDLSASLLLASLAGFLVVGMADSLLDSARLEFLFLLLLAISAAQATRDGQEMAARFNFFPKTP